MQPIERYGVITLMLLVVTIFVVALWKDDAEAKPDSLQAQGQPTEADLRAERLAQEKTRKQALEQQRLADQRAAAERRLALTQQQDQQAARVEPGVTALSLDPGAAAAGSVAQNGGLEAPRVGSPTELPRHSPEGVSLGDPELDARARARDASARRLAEKRQEQGLDPVAGQTPGAGSLTGQKTLTEQKTTSEAPRAGSSSTGTRSGTDAQEVKVARGDSLSEIAERHLGSSRRWREIAALNGIEDPTSIHVGQTLKLPAKGAASTASVAEGASGMPSASRDQHVVRSGEVLSVISQQRLGRASRWREIVALNPNIDPDRLEVGAVLRLPSGASAAPAGSTPALNRGADTQVAVSLTPSSARRRGSKVR